MRKIFHLYLKSDGSHHYFGSLSAIFKRHDVGVSKYTLDRYKFENPFENDTCIIRKGQVVTTKSTTAE